MNDEKFMSLALEQARQAYGRDEVPVGAVVVKNGQVIAVGSNSRNASHSAVEHAELLAIERACKALDDWRLVGCDLYVTLEPCVMCLGACYNARIRTVYFGAYDLSGQGCVQLSEAIGRTLNHELTICGGILERECSDLLTEYFKSKR